MGDQTDNQQPYSSTNNFLTQISIYQCLAFIIGSFFLMTITNNFVSEFFGFVSCILSMLALQFLCGLYERGPYPGNYYKTCAYVNNYMKVSGFSLLLGLFYNIFFRYHGNLLALIVYCIFWSYTLVQIHWYFQVRG